MIQKNAVNSEKEMVRLMMIEQYTNAKTFIDEEERVAKDIRIKDVVKKQTMIGVCDGSCAKGKLQGSLLEQSRLETQLATYLPPPNSKLPIKS